MLVEHITGNLYLLGTSVCPKGKNHSIGRATQRPGSPNWEPSVSARHGREKEKEQKSDLQQHSRKLGWQKQQVSLSCAPASGETTTLSLTVTLLINTPASAGGIIAPASPVILYLTCCYCQTPSPLRETERQRERNVRGRRRGCGAFVCVVKLEAG